MPAAKDPSNTCEHNKAPEPTGDDPCNACTYPDCQCKRISDPSYDYGFKLECKFLNRKPKAPTGDEKPRCPCDWDDPTDCKIHTEPKAPGVTEVVLTPLDVSINDVDWAKATMQDWPLELAKFLACRERQLKAEIAAREQDRKEYGVLYQNSLITAGTHLSALRKAEKERAEWRNKYEAALKHIAELEK